MRVIRYVATEIDFKSYCKNLLQAVSFHKHEPFHQSVNYQFYIEMFVMILSLLKHEY